MSSSPPFRDEPTAVDDVRRVRDRLDRDSGGDLRTHIANTNATFEKLRASLGIKAAGTPPAPAKSKAVSG